jgi:glycosyltransferase involved in cell wall biosynthesis
MSAESNILIIEPYYTGSHAAWAEGYARNSRHRVSTLHLPGRNWKWRMHGGAVCLAESYRQRKQDPDLLLASDMLDLTTFLALTRHRTSGIPTAVYFHENQLSYPWSPEDRDVKNKRDKHYGFINYATALAADALFFNSAYHRDSFLDELPRMLMHFPDYRSMENVERIAGKARVLPVGLDFTRYRDFMPGGNGSLRKKNPAPLVLWNHRWEYDKNPEEFFDALYAMQKRGLDFQVAVLGENFSRRPEVFDQARRKLGDRIVHIGYVEEFADYVGWLCRADILPVTSRQDFFGISIVEAVFCGAFPLLPKRLSYPELLPPELCAYNFYDDFADLLLKMAHALEGIDYIREVSLRSHVERFSWETLAPAYDDVMEEVRSSK